jgi:hypothetical protein
MYFLSSVSRGCHSRVGTCLMQTAIFMGGSGSRISGQAAR